MEKKKNNYYKSPLQKRFRWSSWARNDSMYPGDELISFVNIQLFPEFKRLRNSVDTNEQGRFIGVFFEDTHNYMKSGKLLKEIVNLVDEEIDFHSEKDKQLFGRIYETLLSSLQAAGNSGEFYTPRPVTRFMVDILRLKPGEIVLDPACGTGGFLTDCIDYINENYNVKKNEVLANMIRGIEKKQLPHMLTVTNLMLHGIELPNNIKHKNSLDLKITEIDEKDKVNCILSNPPFGGAEEDSIIDNFPEEFQTKETADLFLLLILNLMEKK